MIRGLIFITLWTSLQMKSGNVIVKIVQFIGRSRFTVKGIKGAFYFLNSVIISTSLSVRNKKKMARSNISERKKTFQSVIGQLLMQNFSNTSVDVEQNDCPQIDKDSDDSDSDDERDEIKKKAVYT